MGLFFGLIGIIGTYFGIPLKNAIINARVIGPAVGGLIGGPLIGFVAGITAAAHRIIVNPEGFTTLACSLATLSEGVIAGFLYRKFQKSDNKWGFAFLIGVGSELWHMFLVLLMAKPFDAALELVMIITPIMVLINALGISIFVGIVESIFKDKENAAALQAQKALNIAEETIKYLRQGLNKETAKYVSKIIYEKSEFETVAIFSRKTKLISVGKGIEQGEGFLEILEKFDQYEKLKFKILNNPSDNKKSLLNNEHKSAIFVPLKNYDEVIGLLGLYHIRENSISTVDIELATGLAALFSNQLELSRIEEKNKLLAKAELKALQAQINPHFLFNALNTINSFIRNKPEEARELLIYLSDCFRNNLYTKEFVPLKEEINNIKSYVKIEQARYGDKLQVNYNIDDDINLKIPSLIVQPIVENSIKHGFKDKLDVGKVWINIENKDDHIHFEIKDNGLGFDIDEVINIIKEGKRESLGLKNVNDRLVNLFGSQYNLDIDTTIGEGTTVFFKIPLDWRDLGNEVYNY
jgi:two-component system sensor histidine kinase LytS